ncbi:MAG: DUF6226 family protein [Acidimicrobiales bacterium]|nr:DUF6226 family protein [Acidimicrobiales bacterium]
MIAEAELLSAVDAVFDVSAHGLISWPDPHGDRAPHDDEYSRVTNPSRWRIVGARAEAWLKALARYDLVEVERDVEVQWRSPPGTRITRTDRVVPRAIGALPLVVARSRIDDTDDAGVTLGLGAPAHCVMWFPYCGCDACDTGADTELDQLDRYLTNIVTGRFRRLSQGEQEITVLDSVSWGGSAMSHQRTLDVLADPSGWDELSGTSWLGGA